MNILYKGDKDNNNNNNNTDTVLTIKRKSSCNSVPPRDMVCLGDIRENTLYKGDKVKDSNNNNNNRIRIMFNVLQPWVRKGSATRNTAYILRKMVLIRLSVYVFYVDEIVRSISVIFSIGGIH